MRISFVEIANYRKLLSVRIDLAPTTTLLVGANNSGKTSAMVALRQFLLQQGSFRVNDFTLCHWHTINNIGSLWRNAKPDEEPSDEVEQWLSVCPTLDFWLDVADGEFHQVSKLLPSLDWSGGLLGVRLRFEPKSIPDLRNDFLLSSSEAAAVRNAMPPDDGGEQQKAPKLWPADLFAFLERRLHKHYVIKPYLLDPTKVTTPSKGIATLQKLPDGFLPLDGDPLAGLIKIHEINAQRGFGSVADGSLDERGSSRPARRLSDQLKRYYAKHLDPQEKPAPEDLSALRAIDTAEEAFDERLQAAFIKAFSEVQGIGYPGVTDPRLKVTTKLRPIDALSHDTALTYEVDTVATGAASARLQLPEDSNGLGYQNLISMIFALMSFRDDWLCVGKAKLEGAQKSDGAVIEPIHLVLIEEPEAHLHAQVQQVFIKKAYDILTGSPELQGESSFKTQVIVSTHSSHVVHETQYEFLRYFRRLPAGMGADVPVSAVLDMATVFGEGEDTKRFVTRYLKAAHCDLFFADAAILLEGPAERMLVPHFIRLHFPYLNQCYISLLEIGGSHAHRLRPLLDHLGILTLVITDIDAGKSGVAAPTKRADGQTTNNPTLKEWLPRLNLVDDLLAADETAKTMQLDTLAAVRVAYQTEINLQSAAGSDADGGPSTEKALPSTFEDSFAFTNRQFFASLQGTGLVAKFREAFKSGSTVTEESNALFNALRNGKKAEFALDVMDADGFSKLDVPAYIWEGLAWIEERLKKKQVDVLRTDVTVAAMEVSAS
jgi:predicted ATP-dependent endonuclease of OLD family